jgi:hypothetical protein
LPAATIEIDARRRGAETVLKRAERRAWTVVAACALAAIVGLGLPAAVAAPLLALGLTVAAIYSWAALRTRAARRGLRHGCRAVLAVGWTRVPDGCNYALFAPDADAAATEPELVIRLPTRREVTTGPGVLWGSTRASRWNSVALLKEDGGLLGVGRVRPSAGGRKVWERRHSPTPWWAIGGSLNEPPDV